MSNLKDYATGTVLTAPSPATTGTSLVLQSGEGSRMPTAPFFATAHPVNQMPTLDNAEKIEVTAVSTDTLTIVRGQGDTTAKSIAAGWRISNTVFSEDIGEWQEWSTGTITNLTVGNGTINYSQYAMVNKVMHLRFKVTLGSTSSVSGNPTFTPPETISTDFTGNLIDALDGSVTLRGSTTKQGVALWATGGKIALRVISASTTYAQHASISSTVPHTWTTGDSISFQVRVPLA